MQDLLAVDICQSIRKLVDDLETGLRRGIAGKENVKADTVDVFHHDARPDHRVHLLGIGLHDVGMVEADHQGILLSKEFNVHSLAG